MAAYGEFRQGDGVEKVIIDQILDANGDLIEDIDDFFLLESLDLVQIFFEDGIPSQPQLNAANGEIFTSYSPRVFKAYNERVFNS